VSTAEGARRVVDVVARQAWETRSWRSKYTVWRWQASGLLRAERLLEAVEDQIEAGLEGAHRPVRPVLHVLVAMLREVR